MVRSLAEDSQDERPLLIGFKGRRNDHVGPVVQGKEPKHRASVGEGDGPNLLLDHMQTVLSVLLHLNNTG